MPSIPISKPIRSNRERLAWYWARTAGMDAREIVHRLVEETTKQFSRRLTQGWEAIEPIGPLASLAGIADSMRYCQPALATAVEHEAEDVRKGRIPAARGPLAEPGSNAPSSGVLAYRP